MSYGIILANCFINILRDKTKNYDYDKRKCSKFNWTYFDIETVKFDETNTYRPYKSCDVDVLSIDICVHMIKKMKGDLCERIGVDNCNEQTDREHRVKVPKR